MSRLATLTRIALTLALLAGGAAVAQAEGLSGALYDVTITNLTRGQVLSPPVVVAHRNGFRVFEAGDAATPELAALAEDADSDDLIALLGTNPAVGDVNIGDDVIPPGASLTVTIEVRGRSRTVSVLGMLVTTNDAFFAGTARVKGAGASFDAPAYDAGSEANTQSCDHIPGPPCGNPFVRVTEGAEGFISISPGIRAAGDLDVALHDWRNPTARVVVSRSRTTTESNPLGDPVRRVSPHCRVSLRLQVSRASLGSVPTLGAIRTPRRAGQLRGGLERPGSRRPRGLRAALRGRRHAPRPGVPGQLSDASRAAMGRGES